VANGKGSKDSDRQATSQGRNIGRSGPKVGVIAGIVMAMPMPLAV